MIESFDKIKILQSSKMVEGLELNLKKKDTLVIKFNQEIWDLEEASQFLEMIKKAMPDISVLAIFNGIELGVIHYED